MNEEKSLNENLGLLRKAYVQFKTAKVVKKIKTLSADVLKKGGCIIAAGLIAFNLAACNNNPDPTPTPSPDTPITGNQNDYSQYSKLLQNVLNSEEYDELLARARSGETDLYTSAYLQPHPYAFLEDQGINVDEIKSGETEAYTMSYVLDEEPNNLYMYTRVLQNNSYYQNYLIKYTLTDEEMEDYHMLHTGTGETHYYIQSAFINNEISKMKTPTIVGQAKISVEAHENLTESFQSGKPTNTDHCNIIMFNIDENSETFTLIAIPKYYDDYKMTYDHLIRESKYIAPTISLNNNIYNNPQSRQMLSCLTSEKKNAVLYFPQDAKLNVVYCKDVEKLNNN